MSTKVIIFDLDGTLLNSKGEPLPSSIEAIKLARKSGLLIGICTGRESQSVSHLLAEWGLDGLIDFIIGNGGGEFIDFMTKKSESNYPLAGELIIDIIHHFKDLAVNFAIPFNGKLYAPKDDTLIQVLSQFDKLPYEVVDFDEFLKEPKPKVMIVCDPDTMPLVLECAKTFSSPQYKSASLQTASVLYEYMDPRISKVSGIQKVLDIHQLTMQECCCFGDADNDYDMVKHAGVGVVMGNGSEKTKSVADVVIDNNDEDGIFNYITQHLI
ncbi:MAG: Cof-type HAD-IIB family hydrolase [Anaerorhabdus sp.]